MTSPEKKEYLKGFRKLGMEIDRKLEEYARLRAWALRISPVLSGMPKGSGITDRVGNVVERLIEVNETINREIDEYLNRREEISAAIEALEDPTLRTILGLYYLNGATWEEVSQKAHYSYMQVTRLQEKALEALPLNLTAPLPSPSPNEERVC